MVFKYAAREANAGAAGQLESEMKKLAGLMGQLTGNKEEIAATASRRGGDGASAGGELEWADV